MHRASILQKQISLFLFNSFSNDRNPTFFKNLFGFGIHILMLVTACFWQITWQRNKFDKKEQRYFIELTNSFMKPSLAIFVICSAVPCHEFAMLSSWQRVSMQPRTIDKNFKIGMKQPFPFDCLQTFGLILSGIAVFQNMTYHQICYTFFGKWHAKNDRAPHAMDCLFGRITWPQSTNQHACLETKGKQQKSTGTKQLTDHLHRLSVVDCRPSPASRCSSSGNLGASWPLRAALSPCRSLAGHL